MDLGNSLFAFGLNYANPSCGGTPLYNGNISQTFWKTANTDNSLKSYTYQYDALNRIKSGIDNTGRYNLASITYDKNGNILSLDRTGHLDDAGTVFGDMDKLTYKYNTGNKLLAVTDAGNTEQGFKDGNTGTGNDDYDYDDNGNMTLDKNKKITNIAYNYLNLPTKISFTFTDDPDKLSEGSIDYVYDAAGIKLAKTVAQKGLQETYDDKNTFYGGNFIYKGTANAKELVFFNHAEGYVEPKEESFAYIYQYIDIFDNIRLAYSDETEDGVITQDEIKEENNYYPFGLKHKGYNDLFKGREHNFKTYQGQEFTTDLGLDAHEWKFRMSDPATGRFWQIDPLSTDYVYNSTYAFQENKMGMGVELEGKELGVGTLVGTLIGAGAGAYNTKGGWEEKLGGAVEGAISGFITGAAVDLTIATGGAATPILQATLAGGIGGGVGGGVGNIIGQGVTNFFKGDDITDIDYTEARGKAQIGLITGAVGGTAGGVVNKGLGFIQSMTGEPAKQMAKNGAKMLTDAAEQGASPKALQSIAAGYENGIKNLKSTSSFNIRSNEDIVTPIAITVKAAVADFKKIVSEQIKD